MNINHVDGGWLLSTFQFIDIHDVQRRTHATQTTHLTVRVHQYIDHKDIDTY